MPEGSSELTARQRAVVERIERRVPIKAIAAELGISPTRVNQHVRAVKDLYGVNSLGELVENYRQDCDPAGESYKPFSEDTDACDSDPFSPLTRYALPKDQFPPSSVNCESRVQDESVEFAFSDALSFPVEAPWTRQVEPAVVPGMLDGHHFVTARLLAMMGAAVGMISLLVLILTSLLSLGRMLEGRWYVPEDNTVQAAERGRAENVYGGSGQSGRMEDQEAHARG